MYLIARNIIKNTINILCYIEGKVMYSDRELVSIIIPMYNSSNSIISTLDSVINQSYQNIELILIDDGSTDNTLELVENYINYKKNNSVQLVSQKNCGASNARNSGIRKCTGKYVMFLDSDDFYLDNMVEVMVNNIEKYNVDAVICGIRKISSIQKSDINIEDNLYSGKNEILKNLDLLIKSGVFNSLVNKIYKRKIIYDNQLFLDENKTVGEDFIFNLNYFDNISSLKVIADCLYNYRTELSYVTKKIRLNEFDIRSETIEELTNFYNKNEINIDLNFQYVKIFYSDIYQLIRKEGFFQSKKLIYRINVLKHNKNILQIKKAYKPKGLLENLLIHPIKIDNNHIILFMARFSFLFRNNSKLRKNQMSL